MFSLLIRRELSFFRHLYKQYRSHSIVTQSEELMEQSSSKLYNCTNEQLSTVLTNLNTLSPKKLLKNVPSLNETQIKQIITLKKKLGGKFLSFDNLKRLEQFIGNMDHFCQIVSSIEPQIEEGFTTKKIHIMPKLNSKTALNIQTAASVEITPPFIYWSTLTNDFIVKDWNYYETNIDMRKVRFLDVYNELDSAINEHIPLKNVNALLIEENIYRYPNLNLVPYITTLQQIRSIFSTLIHKHSDATNNLVYHLNARHIQQRFNLLVGNELTSTELYVTRMLFGNETFSDIKVNINQKIQSNYDRAESKVKYEHKVEEKNQLSLNIDNDITSNYQRSKNARKEPMANCLLRTIAFMELVKSKTRTKELSNTSQETEDEA